jgi:hypothetical protein
MTAQAAGAVPICSGSMQKQIRGWLAVRHFLGTKDPPSESFVQSGAAEGEAHLVVASAGSHAGGYIDGIERF